MSASSSVKQNFVFHYPDITYIVEKDIDAGEEGMISIDAKRIVVLPQVTVHAKSIIATCKKTFVTFGCLDVLTLDLTAKDVYLAGTITSEEGNVRITAEEQPYIGETLAQEALGRIMRKFAEYKSLPPSTCHNSVGKFGKYL